jgi:hypothetical protein
MGIDPIVLGLPSDGSSSDECCCGNMWLRTGLAILARTGRKVGKQAQTTAALISALVQLAMATKSHVGSLE